MGFRLNLYDKGWRPWEVKRLLRDYPQEALFLSIYMEELQAYQSEEMTRMKRGGINTSGPGAAGAGEWKDEATLGGDDEVDWFEALRMERDDE